MCTNVCDAMPLLYDCSRSCKLLLDATITASIVAISRVGSQEAIKILTGSTKYRSIGGCFCDKVVYPDVF